MEELLKALQEPLSNEVVIDSDKFNFFNSQIKVWEYAKILTVEFQKLLFDNRYSILKQYQRRIRGVVQGARPPPPALFFTMTWFFLQSL